MGWETVKTNNFLPFKNSELKNLVSSVWDRDVKDGENDYSYITHNVSIRPKAGSGYSVAYSIISKVDNVSQTREKFIGVTMFNYSMNRTTGNYDFHYYHMDENQFPGEYNAPISFINTLDGINGAKTENGRSWREKAFKYHEAMKKIQDYKKNETPIKVLWGDKHINVTYSHSHKKWVTENMKYLRPVNIKPETVIGLLEYNFS